MADFGRLTKIDAILLKKAPAEELAGKLVLTKLELYFDQTGEC